MFYPYSNVRRCLLYPGVIYCSLRCIIHCKQIRQQKQYWHFRGYELDGISHLERGFRNLRREFVFCVSLGNAAGRGEQYSRDVTLTNDLLLIIMGWRLYYVHAALRGQAKGLYEICRRGVLTLLGKECAILPCCNATSSQLDHLLTEGKL